MMKNLKYILIFVALIIFILLFLKFCKKPSITEVVKVPVNCNGGPLLADTVNEANMTPGAKEFIITGECVEDQPVTITQDNVTISGEGKTKTIIKGTDDAKPVFNIVGARGVTLKGFTVEKGKQGILVTDGAKVEISQVSFQGNEGTSLCIVGVEKNTSERPGNNYIEQIGAEKNTSQRPRNNYIEQINENCPQVSQIEYESPIKQSMTYSKKFLSAVSSIATDSIIKDANAQVTDCLGNNPDPNSTYVNICDSDISSPGPIARGNSTVAMCKPDGSHCTLDISGNSSRAGLLLFSNSQLDMQKATLKLLNNGAGMVLITSTAMLKDNSQIFSTGNIVVDIVYPSGSNIDCDSSSSITAEIVTNDAVPPMPVPIPTSCIPNS